VRPSPALNSAPVAAIQFVDAIKVLLSSFRPSLRQNESQPSFAHLMPVGVQDRQIFLSASGLS
jgi:hypothetical protein